jgi:hypothetical protein
VSAAGSGGGGGGGGGFNDRTHARRLCAGATLVDAQDGTTLAHDELGELGHPKQPDGPAGGIVQLRALLELTFKRGDHLRVCERQEWVQVAPHAIAHLARGKRVRRAPLRVARDPLVEDHGVHGLPSCLVQGRGLADAGSSLTRDDVGQRVHEAIGREDDEGTCGEEGASW